MIDDSLTVPHPRILHVTSVLDPGGIETWLLRLATIPEGRRLIGGILVLSNREGLLAPQFRERNIPIHLAPVSKNPLAFVRDLAFRLRQTGPWEVVHSHVYRRSVLVHLACRLAGVPLRVTHSHTTKSRETESRYLVYTLLGKLATRWINAVSSLRIACSREAAAALFGPGALKDPRLLCLPCGMDVDAFLHSAEAPVSRASLGIPGGAIVVGHVGRFMPQKNHEYLLRVARAASHADPRLHFLLIGDGSLRSTMERLAADLGIGEKVTFTGNRLDVPSLMKHAMDCFFLPSLWEGLGIVALEAQALGLPCLFSEAIPEEANRLPGRNQVFSLGASPAETAGQLVRIARLAQEKKPELPDPHDFLYSIADNARLLGRAYASTLAAQTEPIHALSRSGKSTERPLNREGVSPWN